MKKRILSFLLFMLVLLAFPSNCLADNGTQFNLSELGMTLEIPSNYYVLTRDISSSDPALPFFGFSQSECIEFLKSRNIYLDAVDPEVTTEITVTMTEIDVSDLLLLPDSAIDTLLSAFSELYASNGLTINDSRYVQDENAKYIVLDITQSSDSGDTYGIQYITIHDYKVITISLHSFDGPLSVQDNYVIRLIMQSVDFLSSSATPVPAKRVDAFSYTDSDTDTSFTVPANWETAELSKPREMIDVKFQSTDGEALIMYGSTDFWGELTAAERAGLTRNKCDLSVFSEQDLKDFAISYGSKNGTYTREKYGGVDYVLFDTLQTSGAFSIPITAAITINNGYLYFFQFSGGNSKAHYEDFVLLLNSVIYKSTTTGAASVGDNHFPVVFIVGGIVIVGVVVCLVVVNASRKKAASTCEDTGTDTAKSITINEDISTEHTLTQVHRSAMQCPSCGKAIPGNCKYCPFCGTKRGS